MLGCLHDAAAAFALDSNLLNKIQRIREQIFVGLPDDCLDWAAMLRNEILTRSSVLRLIQLGYRSPAQIHKEDHEHLSTVLSPEAVKPIFEYRKIGSAENISANYVLEVSKSRPDQIIVNTHKIQLTKIQSAIIHCLIKKTGECVDYETIIREVWPSSIATPKMLSRQKTALLNKITQIIGKKPVSIIETVPGIGLLLEAEVKRRR